MSRRALHNQIKLRNHLIDDVVVDESQVEGENSQPEISSNESSVIPPENIIPPQNNQQQGVEETDPAILAMQAALNNI